MTKDLCSVTYTENTVTPEGGSILYWFEAKVHEYEHIHIRFGLIHTGDLMMASENFFNLPHSVKQEVLTFGRQLLLKVLN